MVMFVFDIWHKPHNSSSYYIPYIIKVVLLQIVMETVIVAIRPHQSNPVTAEFDPAAYDILLTDVKLANADKLKGFKQLPKTTVSYDQEPAEALCACLFSLTGGENGGLKGTLTTIQSQSNVVSLYSLCF